jgi:hypothetical protein
MENIMTDIVKLIAYINTHDNLAFATRDNQIVAQITVCQNGVARQEWELVAPTVSAVLNWLGY